ILLFLSMPHSLLNILAHHLFLDWNTQSVRFHSGWMDNIAKDDVASSTLLLLWRRRTRLYLGKRNS
ncbi:MAG: hypothetical protein AAFO96_28035, partial [Bacteroidota bacterium]